MFEYRRKGLWYGKTMMTAAAFVLLTGCTSDFGPWPFPTGYTYHNEEYKAPAGPEPVFKKWEAARKNKKKQDAAPAPVLDTHFAARKAKAAQASAPVSPSPDTNDSQLWLSAANDLTGRLFTKFGKPTEPVYLPSPGAAEQDQFFAAALHAALQDQGAAIAAQPGAGPFSMHYKTNDTGSGEGRLLLTITMQSGTQTLAEESGIYTVGGGAGAGSGSASVPVKDAGGAPTSLAAPSGAGGF